MFKTYTLLLAAFIIVMITDEGLLAQSFPNIYIHPNTTTFQFEPSIATHPSDPNIVLVAPVARNNNVSRIGWYYTTDGGNTWSGRDTLPTHPVLGTQMTDPSAGIDLNGNLFISGIYGTTNIFVARRDTAGVWAQTIAATPLQAERPHMAIDQNPASLYRNYIYLVYSDVGQPQPRPALFVRSTDQGQTFSTPITISGTFAAASNFGANLAVGVDSTLYVTWSGFDAPPFNNPPPQHLGFNMSTDGGATWGTARDLRLIEYSGSAHGVSFFNHPVMAVDRSNGPRRGWIYIAYAERNPSAPDIFLIRSSNHGSTWSDPVKVSQDSDTTKDQWQPWISVDPHSGNVFVVYLDARNFPSNDSAQVYLSASKDGGSTFRDILISDVSDILISDVPFLPTPILNYPPVVPNYMGSYIGIASLRDTIWTSWNDNRTGLMLEGRRLHQVLASRVVFPIVPVELTSFTASSNGKSLTLNWSTASEINNYGFDVQRSSEKKEFYTIGFVNGKGTTAEQQNYIYTDKNLNDGKYYYRLKQIDFDGSYEYSDVVEVDWRTFDTYLLEQNFPNPFNPITTIGFGIQNKSNVRITILNAIGEEAAVILNEEREPGFYEVEFNAANLPSGVYFYQLRAGKFIQTKKMILMK